MNHEQGEDWRPTASWEHFRLRARLLAEIRAFFQVRGVLEVETPLLSSATVTDVHLQSFVCQYVGPGAGEGLVLYLQTSPEFAMKRLLAAGSGPIYQISKAFRNGEWGPRHNPEFTLLEWYRPGFDHRAMMDDVESLLQRLLGVERAERITYQELFLRELGVDPHRASVGELRRRAAELGLAEAGSMDLPERDDWFHWLMVTLLEARLGVGRPTFVYDFPPSQAALARIRDGNPPVAERFEVYVEGVELGNGFHELLDAEEQRRRFEEDRRRRLERGLDVPPVDERLLAALTSGLPPCSGVALGLDRLVVLAAKASLLSEVIAFPLDRA